MKSYQLRRITLMAAAMLCVLAHSGRVTHAADRISPIVATPGVAPTDCRLINMSCGAAWNSKINPSLPTFVITHGWNPAPKIVRLTTQEAYARKIRARYNGRVNVLAFQWDSRGKGTPWANNVNAKQAGTFLGSQLLSRGVNPRQTTMIGHSMGTIVVAAAAKCIHAQTGRCVLKLVLIDGPTRKMRIVMNELDVSKTATKITNVWATGPTGLGTRIRNPRVENIRAGNRRRQRGRQRSSPGLDPAPNNHVDVLLWYYERFL